MIPPCSISDAAQAVVATGNDTLTAVMGSNPDIAQQVRLLLLLLCGVVRQFVLARPLIWCCELAVGGAEGSELHREGVEPQLGKGLRLKYGKI